MDCNNGVNVHVMLVRPAVSEVKYSVPCDSGVFQCQHDFSESICPKMTVYHVTVSFSVNMMSVRPSAPK